MSPLRSQPQTNTHTQKGKLKLIERTYTGDPTATLFFNLAMALPAGANVIKG